MANLTFRALVCCFCIAFLGENAESNSFSPPPGKYELYHGMDLRMYIRGPQNTTCVYETIGDKNYKCAFETNPKKSPIKADTNVCYDRVQIVSGCEFFLPKYEESDPRTWTLYDLETANDKLTVTVDLYYKAKLYNTDNNVMEGNGVVQYLVIDGNPKLTKCTAIYGNVTFDVPLQLEDTKFDKLENDFARRALPLGNGKCGYQLTNAKVTDMEKCFLVAEAEDGKRYKTEFSFKIKANKPNEETLTVHIGDGITIRCEDNDICQLKTPNGEKILPNKNRCTYYIKTVTPDHIGMWTCTQATGFSMVSLTTKINLKAKGVLNTETWSKQVGDTLQIGCKVANNPMLPKKFCSMVTPGGANILVDPKITTSRYTAFTTDLDNGICGLEIKLPLLDEEKGNWKCQLNDEIGTFVATENTKNSYPTRIQKTVQLGEDVAITCQVPYSSPHCQITSPTGEIFASKYLYRSWLGECSILVQNASKEHNGTWTCNYARHTGLPDEQIYFDLKVSEVLLTYSVKQVTRGDSVNLMCETGLPIKYCRFITPNGMSYHLSEVSNTTIDYYGRGLEYGDCGISIKKVTEKHSGIWTCVTRIGYRLYADEIKAKISLQVNDVPFFNNGTNVAASVGGSLGAIVVLAGLGYLLWRRKRRNNPNYSLTSRSSDTSGSNDQVNQQAVPAILYDNDENVIYQIRQRNSVDNTL